MEINPQLLKQLLRKQPEPLRPTLSKPKSVWEFANSSFGLFLFSSVFISMLSFSYGQWRDHNARQRKAEQLYLEIALRIQAVGGMSSGPECERYSNLVNIAKVMAGDPKSSFYVRKPMFNEFDNKNTVSLLWQLYLVVPTARRGRIKSAIKEINLINDEGRQIRYQITNDFDDQRPKAKTQKERDKQDDEDDKIKKDYGQSEIFRQIHALSQDDQWKNPLF